MAMTMIGIRRFRVPTGDGAIDARGEADGPSADTGIATTGRPQTGQNLEPFSNALPH
ncbi:hypothetical protein [Bifidobacterium pullorum]|uniref:hypothetical protein n=1 Tax=Bifidobacterium pullorum TaxID=78448 RepID=UPI003208FC5E